MSMKKDSDFVRGVKTAAALAGEYNGSTTHAYRLDDCILGKLNIDKRKMPRKNKKKLQDPNDAWTCGFVVALAESNRHIPNHVVCCEAASNANITIAVAKKAGVDPYDWRELRRAGVEEGVAPKRRKS